MRTIIAVFAFLLVSTLTAQAKEKAICDASGACANKSSNVEYKDCLYKLAEEQDKELNVLYKKVRAMLRDDFDKVETSAPKIWPQVRDAQRNWIKFRDNQCSGEASIAQGGTAAGGWYSDCLCRLTHQRNQNLRFILKSWGPQQ